MEVTAITGMGPAHPHGARPSFTQFVLKDRGNRMYLWIAIAAVLLQLVIFKYAYPFADFFSDAYTYIQAAADHAPISYRQIGYSRFLALLHGITVSDTAVVCCQYLFIELAALYFFFSLLYFFDPAKEAMWVLFILLFFDPAFLYLSNYITSDALFAATSILWITELMWIINRPRLFHIMLQALALAVAFNLRYTALFYPLIATLAFLVSPLRPVKKTAGIVLSVLLVLGSAWYTVYKTWKVTGTASFSAFSGWQLANNALHMYPHIDAGPPGRYAGEQRKLDSMVRNYFNIMPTPSGNITTHYMWDTRSPLKQYLRDYLDTHANRDYFTGWNAAGPLFSNYGWELIKAHPFAFAKYYLIPNTGTYLLPHLESMQVYNGGLDTVDATAVSWFGYRGSRITSVSTGIQGTILAPFPLLFFMGNILFIITCIWVFSAKIFRNEGPAFFASILVLACFIALNTAFSIFATMNILRYTLFPLVMVYAFPCIVTGTFLRSRRQYQPPQ